MGREDMMSEERVKEDLRRKEKRETGYEEEREGGRL